MPSSGVSSYVPSSKGWYFSPISEDGHQSFLIGFSLDLYNGALGFRWHGMTVAHWSHGLPWNLTMAQQSLLRRDQPTINHYWNSYKQTRWITSWPLTFPRPSKYLWKLVNVLKHMGNIPISSHFYIFSMGTWRVYKCSFGFSSPVKLHRRSFQAWAGPITPDCSETFPRSRWPVS